jgi:hypothetical protein
MISEPDLEYEIRVCVFETEGLPYLDIEGTSDIYIVGSLDQNTKQKTDTHYRCMTGKGSFNYRFVFNFKAPREQTVLTL